MPLFRLSALAAFLCVAPMNAALADPWLQPGDQTIRHDIEVLADAGIIKSPVTTWPMSWPDIASDVTGVVAADDATTAVREALFRVQRHATRASHAGASGIGYRVAGAREPIGLRTYSDSPREEAELEVGIGWLGNRFAANVSATMVSNASDDQTFRWDGTYVGVNVANFMISAGWMERWWGPGWEGSLILSSNARPIPSIRVERNYTKPFETKWLSWLGSWRASLELGQAEGSDVPVPDTRFLAARLNFRPARWFEFGLSRTAQWCGEGRPCGFDTFTDLIIGNDNDVDESSGQADQPGNQMAGYDLRASSPWKILPVAIYGQAIGEDEAGKLPSKFLGLVGIETWGSVGWGSYRIHAEIADTTCNFSRKDPEYNCAYRNALYPQGYTFRGRSIGHSLDSDGRMYSVQGLLVRPNGDSVSLLVRRSELNRDGELDSAHTVSPSGGKVDNVEVEYNRGLKHGRLRFGAGYDEHKDAASTDNEFRGFIEWRQNL